MPDQILIEGNVAKLLSVHVVSEVPIEEVRNRLHTVKPTTFPLLPRNTVAASMSQDGRHCHLILEAAPMVTTMKVAFNESGAEPGDEHRVTDSTGMWTVSIPFGYFHYYLERTARDEWYIADTWYYWRPKRLTKLDDPVWPAHVPNVGSDAHICFGDTYTGGATLVDQIYEQTNNFFASVFNDDMGLNLPGGYNSFTAWENNSEADIFCWRNWYWGDSNALFITDTFESDPNDQKVNLTTPPAGASVSRHANWIAANGSQSLTNFVTAMLEGGRTQEVLTALNAAGYMVSGTGPGLAR